MDTEFDALVARHLDGLRAAAARLAGSADEAAELVQECLSAAVAALPRLRRRDLLGPWLHQILRRKHVDALRRRYREKRLRDAAPPAPAPALDAEPVRQALAALSGDERRVVEMRYFEGRTSADIARVLRKPAGTVRSILFHALRKLEAAYRKICGDTP